MLRIDRSLGGSIMILEIQNRPTITVWLSAVDRHSWSFLSWSCPRLRDQSITWPCSWLLSALCFNLGLQTSMNAFLSGLPAYVAILFGASWPAVQTIHKKLNRPTLKLDWVSRVCVDLKLHGCRRFNCGCLMYGCRCSVCTSCQKSCVAWVLCCMCRLFWFKLWFCRLGSAHVWMMHTGFNERYPRIGP